MNKSKIEWCDYTINPIKGLCPIVCPYCYARRMYKRFKLDGSIRFDENAFQPLMKVKEPSRIFVGSTMELFGDWVKREWMMDIISMTQVFKQHTFIFLTKRPENLIKYSPFPKNCWVGVSATDDKMFTYAWQGLKDVQATVKFISFEPLLKWGMSVQDIEFTIKTAGINWLIIGQQTPPKVSTIPSIEWIQSILVGASNAGNIPVFMKNNLLSCLDKSGWNAWKLRQEYPIYVKKRNVDWIPINY